MLLRVSIKEQEQLMKNVTDYDKTVFKVKHMKKRQVFVKRSAAI